MIKKMIFAIVLSLLTACSSPDESISETTNLATETPTEQLTEDTTKIADFIDPRPIVPVSSPTRAIILFERQLHGAEFTEIEPQFGDKRRDLNGKLYRVDYKDEVIEVFEYGLADLAALDAGFISEDGYSFVINGDKGSMTKMAFWDFSETPHYFLYDTLLIRYCGDNQEILTQLSEITDIKLGDRKNDMQQPPTIYLAQGEQKAPAVQGTTSWQWLNPSSLKYESFEGDSVGGEKLVQYQDRRFLVERGSEVSLVLPEEPYSYTVTEYIGQDNYLIVPAEDGKFSCNSDQDKAIYCVTVEYLQGKVHYAIEVLFEDSYVTYRSSIQMIEYTRDDGTSVRFESEDLWDYDYGDVAIKEVEGVVHGVINLNLDVYEGWRLTDYTGISWPDLRAEGLNVKSSSFSIGPHGVPWDWQKLDLDKNYNIKMPLRHLKQLIYFVDYQDAEYVITVEKSNQEPFESPNQWTSYEKQGSSYIIVEVTKRIDDEIVVTDTLPEAIMMSIEKAKEAVVLLNPYYGDLELVEE